MGIALLLSMMMEARGLLTWRNGGYSDIFVLSLYCNSIVGVLIDMEVRGLTVDQ